MSHQVLGSMERHVHGEGGAYVGGEWVDIEDCAERINVSGSSSPKGANGVQTGSTCTAQPQNSGSEGRQESLPPVIMVVCLGSSTIRLGSPCRFEIHDDCSGCYVDIPRTQL